ncbi:hypothetical protein QTP70_018717, partial [Hemibagrus guttatus]
EDSFELHSVDLELEAVEKQIRDLQVKQAQLQQRKAAVELPRARTRPAQVSFTPAPGYHAAWMQQQRKTQAKTRARTSPPPPPPVFEIPTQNRFASLRETACDAVIIGDSIVRHVRATAAKGKVHTRCLPGARVLDVSAQVPAILKKNIGAVVLHAGTNDIRLRQTEILKKDFRSLVELVCTTSPTTRIIVSGPLPTFQRGIERQEEGTITTEAAKMRREATKFYTDLYSAEDCDPCCTEELLRELPKLSPEQSSMLGAGLELQEVATAVQQLAVGRAPGIYGLPNEFYKHFVGFLGTDLLEVFKSSFINRKLPTSCTRTVLSLLPNKGDLGLLKNWTPVALLGSDYKILSKCLANRLKQRMHTIVHNNQSYCIPNRTIMDNLFLVRDVIDLCRLNSCDLGFLSLDQEKAFDRVDHDYLFQVGGGLSCLVRLERELGGVVGKVCAKLSQWTWVLPQLSYISFLWHRFTVLEPPEPLIKEVQKRIVNFFWAGQHWTRAPVLYLPLQEGGQSLIDLSCRVRTFRLQVAQRLLYGEENAWADTAYALLRHVEDLNYDKHLFMLNLREMDLSATTLFYQSVKRAWSSVLRISRINAQPFPCTEEEPLFHNPLIQSRMISSPYIQQRFRRAGITRVKDLRSGNSWKTTRELCAKTGVLSVRLMLGEVTSALPSHFREALGAGPWEKPSAPTTLI